MFASCDPFCAQGEYCNAESTCIAHPESRGAGQLTVKGLGDTIQVEAESYSVGTYVGPTDLQVDPLGGRREEHIGGLPP